MLQLINETAYAASLFPGIDAHGRAGTTLVLKAGWVFDARGRLQPATAPSAISATDRYRGEPGASSLAVPSDAAPYKQGAELYLTGTAFPPVVCDGIFQTSIGIRWNDGTMWRKSVDVFGRRRWRLDRSGATMETAAPPEATPLTLENAFGGSDAEGGFALNPVGRGFLRSADHPDGVELPLIEDSRNRIAAPDDQPEPAGFGPVPRAWQTAQGQPVFALAEDGTDAGDTAQPQTDEPTADAQYNAAPADQRFEHGFEGGERLALMGLFDPRKGADGRLALSLPVVNPQAALLIGDTAEPLALQCDTLAVDTDECTVHLLWRVHVARRLFESKTAWIRLAEAPS